MRRLLVTGGCGFMGSSFVHRALRDLPDAEIKVLDALTYAGRVENIDEVLGDGRAELVQGDVRDPFVAEDLVDWADQIVHFAAESHVDYSAAYARIFVDTNVMGTATILEAMLRHPVERLVYISSSEVYGSAVRTPMDEDHPLNPASPYAGTKAAADRLVYSFVRAHALPALILRPFNNYGPRQHVEKVIPRFITAALDAQPLTIHDSGQQTRDWVHVDDTSSAVIHALEAPIASLIGEVVNVGSGDERSVLEIASFILQAVGARGPEALKLGSTRPGQVWRHHASTEKALRLLGWRATVPFEVGLGRTIAWYRDNESWWRSLKPSLVPAQVM